MTPDFDKIADKLVSLWPDAAALHTNIRAALEAAWNAALEEAAGFAETVAKETRADENHFAAVATGIAAVVRARKIGKEA